MTLTICEALDEPPLSRTDDLDQLKQRLSTEQFYLAECDVGLGIFANRDIAPGEHILDIQGPIIDFAETKRRGPRECMAIQIGPDRYIDTQAPGVFINHSCEPNAGIRGSKHLVALSLIRKGQEVRYDYSTTMEEQSFTMECRCGAPSCRRVVRDFSTLPLPLQHRYISRRIVMQFILDCLFKPQPRAA
ncbi:MAG TPA: SET domain-containing protein-lysine N-methyltransferase [Clostridia bacterium]|nr:SET domain-containing protein-lysine N-methyltransferase [Clostridia bacterium]